MISSYDDSLAEEHARLESFLEETSHNRLHAQWQHMDVGS